MNNQWRSYGGRHFVVYHVIHWLLRMRERNRKLILTQSATPLDHSSCTQKRDTGWSRQRNRLDHPFQVVLVAFWPYFIVWESGCARGKMLIKWEDPHCSFVLRARPVDVSTGIKVPFILGWFTIIFTYNGMLWVGMFFINFIFCLL